MNCKKCGKEINKTDIFCPNCGTKIEKRSNRKLVGIGILIFVVIIAGIILVPCFRGALSDKVEKQEYSSDKPFSIYTLNSENVKHDDSSGIDYVDNMIIIFFDNEATEDYKNGLIQSINGTIKGQIKSANQYQVEVSPRSLEELKYICNGMEEAEYVLNATYDTVVDSDILSESIPNDKWGDNLLNKNIWDEDNPIGNNWWAEAIQAPSAWDYNDKFKNIKIGIVDSGFDYNHEDLQGKITFLSKNNQELNNKDAHGTHVAGIIGAIPNNEKGITGLVWNSELLCYDWEPTWIQEKLTNWNTETQIYGGLIRSVEAGAKVVNFSLGKSHGLENNQKNYSEDDINHEGEVASTYIASLLLSGNDFVVVQSAGNGDSDGMGVDAKNNCLFASVTEDNCVSITDKVSKKDILERIIIVGNAMNDGGGKFTQALDSNGGTQVDICAPGTDIYSTIPGDWSLFQFHGSYETKSGTSMAAPIVSGVAAMVWSANENLTGADVKRIVCDGKNTVYSVDDNPKSPDAIGTYRMVNAKLAVEAALKNEKDSIAYNYGENTLIGVINKEKWTHTLENDMTAYILHLETPATFNLQGDYELRDISEVQIWTDKIDEKYIGKKVKVTGDISRQAGTIYYRRNVVIWPAQISFADSNVSSPDDNSSILAQQTKSPASNNKEILEIKTTEDLIAFSANVNAGNSYTGKTVKLLNDLTFDANATGNYESAGKTDKPFSGVFEGNNHTITGINIYQEKDYAGLFGYISNGTVQNLTVNNVIIKGCSDVGVIAGGLGNGSIRNCTVSGELSISRFTTSAGSSYGGVVGYSGKGSIINCTSNVSIDAKAHIGGIVGDARQSSITDCVNNGNIESSTGPCGGIVGSLGYSGTNSTISSCRNSGTLTGNTNGLAGIVGEVHTGSSVQWSYNSGSIDGFAVAGIVGLNHGFVRSCYNVGSLKARAGAGGISFMCNRGGKIENCYNAGAISGSGVGGISGAMGNRDTKGDGGTIENCYYLDSSANVGVHSDADDGIINNVVAVSDTELQSVNFVNTLNDGYHDSENNKPWKAGNPYPVIQ